MRRTIWVGLTAILLAGASARAEEVDLDRMSRETASLFRVLMSKEEPPHRCSYDVAWAAYPIPEYVAQKYLGVIVHANLTPPDVATRMVPFQSIVDGGGKHTDAFCDEKEAAKALSDQANAFRQNRSADEMVVRNTSFTLPVFNADYTRAVVIVEYSEKTEARLSASTIPTGSTLKPGDLRWLLPGSSAVAKVYVKTGDRWSFLEDEVVSQT